ncbi:hypothetical protein [Ornithinimicrobium tianjinense]|uniref:Uncharacterized protein n=1 Tax=Ornithinimicrobium tianjinense TaxID=1195761 RepID=A0A917F8U9_9MICO|nr:hypothetical protein [Ornithinimicrobium tianjinense]GGF58561.1 hypothetical protein GCM10011366_27980 [Ornithinimicrobium tianjinense]
MDKHEIDARVEVREIGRGRAARTELLVDGEPVRHGRLPGGKYFLYDNAYVWSDDLRGLGRQLVVDRAARRVPTPGPADRTTPSATSTAPQDGE